MPLPQLFSGLPQVDVQQTAFSLDAVARLSAALGTRQRCTEGRPLRRWSLAPGCTAHTARRRSCGSAPTARVLLLDAGRFLVSEHVQNLANIGFNVPGAIPPASDPGVPRELVWGIPWRGNTEFPGVAYCTGGKSIFWGGWCPRLTASDLSQWPAATAQYLVDHYIDIESEIGVQPATDFIFGELGDVLRAACVSAAAATPNIDTSIGTNGVETAPLAVQGSPPVSGLFSFDKYSSLPVLLDAIRADVNASGGQDAARRLFLVPLAHVVRLHATGGTVHTVEVEVGGQRRFLSLAQGANVVLAASAVETTRLALESFPTALMGRNLMAHLRSDFTVRVRRQRLAHRARPRSDDGAARSRIGGDRAFPRASHRLDPSAGIRRTPVPHDSRPGRAGRATAESLIPPGSRSRSAASPRCTATARRRFPTRRAVGSISARSSPTSSARPARLCGIGINAPDLQTWQAMDAAIVPCPADRGSAHQYRVSIRRRMADTAVSACRGPSPNGIAGSGRRITNRARCGWATIRRRRSRTV